MLTNYAITRRADDDGVAAMVVERDYVLAHVVAQLNLARPADGGRVVFKGGSALRLVHVGEYRYSADLDLTVIDGTADQAVGSLSEVLEKAKEHAGFPLLELTTSGKLQIQYVGPLQAGKPRFIKVDASGDEHVESVTQGTILDGIWDDLPASTPFDVYPIDEIGAEKLRCVIQRVQCRDLYDLYRLTEDGTLSLAEIRPLFETKTRAKDIDPEIFAERFADRIGRYSPRWDKEMGEHVADPPRFEEVVRSVRRHLRAADLL